MLAGRFGWGEAVRLARMLEADPSAQVCAAVNGWQHPLSREGFIASDLFDLTAAANWPKKAGKREPYPRPTDPPPKRLGDPSKHTQADILAALRARGHGVTTTTDEAPRKRVQPRDARGRFCRAP